MSGGPIWEFKRNAVPSDLCGKAVQEIQSASPAHAQQEQDVYALTATCKEIFEYVVKHLSKDVEAVKPNSKAHSSSVFKFLKLERPALKLRGKEEEVYVAVALSPLSDATGMFARANTSQVPTLNVGDVVIWTREVGGRNNVGHGGLMQVIMFR